MAAEFEMAVFLSFQNFKNDNFSKEPFLLCCHRCHGCGGCRRWRGCILCSICIDLMYRIENICKLIFLPFFDLAVELDLQACKSCTFLE
jgi:hypothetical protein